MKYNCAICNYETNENSHFVRHTQSAKHRKKSKATETLNNNKNQTSDTSEHIKYQCTSQDNYNFGVDAKNFQLSIELNQTKSMLESEQKKNEKITLELELLRQEKQIRNEMEQKINEIYTQKNKEIMELIKSLSANSNKANEKQIITLSYVNANYKNAPCIELLQKKQLSELFVYDNQNASIMDTFISYHELDKLHVFLGDLIIKKYVIDDSQNQSIWCSDVTRFNFILRIFNKNNDCNQWMTDKNGVNLKKLIILPIIESSVKIINQYVKNNFSYIEKNKNDPNAKHQIFEITQSNTKAIEIINSIKPRILENMIVKHISPHFCMKINDIH